MRWAYIICTIVCLCSCRANPGRKIYEFKGVVLGKDTNSCRCCGGYIMTIEDDTTTYHFACFPSDVKMDTTRFPIRVLLNCGFKQPCDSIHKIIIHNMQILYRNAYSYPVQ